MKFATYNIWNEASNLALRVPLLLREIADTAADVIALQEVPPSFVHNGLAGLSQYPYQEFRRYSGEDEGLAVLSRHPIISCAFLHEKADFHCAAALNVLLEAGGERISVTNVHLPWGSPLKQEEQITAANAFVHGQEADHFLLMGDFNCGLGSSVHRFLAGEQSLCGQEAAPCWLDVSSAVAALQGRVLPPTLDCINNPRWRGRNQMYAPANLDRIYILDTWNPYAFRSAALFGTELDPDSCLCGSDHYGVVVDIDW